jgi:cytochrome c5
MKKLFKIVLYSGLILLFQSCYYDTVIEEEVIPPPDDVSYSRDIMPLWKADCVSCHKGGTTFPPDLRDENSWDELVPAYVVPFESDESSLMNSLYGTNGEQLMPPAGIWSDNKINLVKAWIDQGAKNN